MQNLMILGANTLQIPLIQQAKMSGYNVIAVSPQPSEPGFKYADYSIYEDVRQKEVILRYAEKYHITGILTDQTDIPVRTAAYIAEKMGLPGIGYDTACLFTDKFLMREKCKELGIPTLKYKKVNNVEDAIKFHEMLNNDVILKPIDNQGSKGVFIASNKEELIMNFEEACSYSNEKSVLIEEYVKGKEFVIEGLAHNYTFENLICGEYNHFNLPGVFSSAFTIYPTLAKDDLVERLENINMKIITGYGLNNARTHSEFIVNEEGEIYLIETAARGGGTFISSDIVPLTTGVNNEELLINIATNKLEELPIINRNNNYGSYIAFYLPEGEIITLNNINEVRALPYTHRNNLDTLKIGMNTKSFSDKTGRKFIIVSAPCYEQLLKNIETIRQMLIIEVKTENGVKGPIWN